MARTALTGRLDPALGHHGGQVDVGHVVGPVDGPGVEAVFPFVAVVQAVPHLQQPVYPEQRLALGVGPVELHVSQRPLHLIAALVQVGGDLGLAASDGQPPQHSFGGVQPPAHPLELADYPAPARIGPVGRGDGLVSVVVDGVLAEPAVGQIGQLVEPERVDRSRCHLDDRPFGVVAPGGHRADSCGHKVHRDHVQHPLGNARKIGEQPPPITDDDGLGHAEPPDPPREGLGVGRLDDRRPHGGHLQVALDLGHRGLGQRFGKGVGVGESQRGGPRPAGFHHMVVDPSAPELLGLGGQGRGAGRAQLVTGSAAELV